MFGAAQLARANFYGNLATSLQAGLGAREALGLAGRGGASAPGMRLESAVAEGRTLADGMAEDPASWSMFERRVVEAGERGGRLPVCLSRLQQHFEQRGHARDRIGLGLLYPLFLIHFAFLAPQAYLLISQGVGAYLTAAVGPLAALWVVVIGGFVAVKAIRASEGGRRATDSIAIAIPGIGGIVKTIALLEYSSTLGALFSSGIPAVEAMEHAASATRNSIFSAAASRAAMRVREGERIHEALATEPVLPRVLVEAVRLGETTGKMDEALERVERTTREEADRKIRIISTVVPFVVYVGAMLVVAMTIVSVYKGAVIDPARDIMNDALGR
jgi:type II secretory pathway component PulF